MLRPFRVSTKLKDLIGRDLITNDFVAVFKRVKNSFDARATSVRILWVFVAYSAKREGTENADYRDGTSQRGCAYAGAKGVGRFSCPLRLQILDVNWTRFEEDARKEFRKIKIRTI